MGRGMRRKPYPSDLTDAQWEAIRALLPPAKNGRTGRPRTVPLREIWNALIYIAKNGCSWRALPHDFPHHDNVRKHFARWKACGLLETVHDALRPQVREASGRDAEPTAGSLDSQSVRTAEKRGVPGGTTRGRRSRGASASSA
ncbi:MAG: transposase [Chloroflexota bacterium]|nr:transposase [Chloroflexota bacterium]